MTPRIRRKKAEDGIAAAEEAAASQEQAAKTDATLALGDTGIVQATAVFTYGERVIRQGETFRASHPLVKEHPHLFEPFTVENEFATTEPRA